MIIVTPVHGKRLSRQTTINRLLQSSNADADEVKQMGSEIKSLWKNLEMHCQEAQKSHDYYIEVSKCCASEWKEISELSKKSNL